MDRAENSSLCELKQLKNLRSETNLFNKILHKYLNEYIWMYLK